MFLFKRIVPIVLFIFFIQSCKIKRHLSLKPVDYQNKEVVINTSINDSLCIVSNFDTCKLLLHDQIISPHLERKINNNRETAKLVSNHSQLDKPNSYEWPVKNHILRKKYLPKESTKEYPLVLLVVLCFLIPFLAVGLKSNWDMVKVIIALLLWPTFFFAIIFALLIVYDIIDF